MGLVFLQNMPQVCEINMYEIMCGTYENTQPIKWQQLNVCSHAGIVKRFSCFLDQMSEWGRNHLSDFDCGMTVVAIQDGLSSSEIAALIADLLRFSHTTVSRGCKEWCKKTKNIQ